MPEEPITWPSLLLRLRDARDADAWQQFVRLYAPLVYGFARRRGLQDADAADLTQEVLRAVAGAAGRLDYDPRRGSFRGWLFTVVRNKVLNFYERGRRHCPGSGDTAVQALLEGRPAGAEDEAALWELEYRRGLMATALEQVRGDFHGSTWEAFRLTALEGRKPREAARTLGTSVAAVYKAKGRVLARLRDHVRQLQESCPGEAEVSR
jgi:RNA polymerase sigma-70 factor (ECF subfamily)